MQHFEKCARDSQWMCSARCDVNNICKLRSWTEAHRKCQHSGGGLSNYDAFCSSVQVSWNILSTVSCLLFKIFTVNETFMWLKLVSLTSERKMKIWKFWADFVDNKYENNIWRKKHQKIHKKRKWKMKDIHCKREKSWLSKWTKDILQLQVQFVSILLFELNHYLIRLEVRIFSL